MIDDALKDLVPGAGSPQTLGSWYLTTVVTALLCGLGPLIIILLTPDPQQGAWVGAVAVTLLAGARLAWFIGGGAQRLVETSMWVFVYVFLGLAPLVQLRTGLTPGTTPSPVHRLDTKTFAVILTGIACFLAGTSVPSRRAPVVKRLNTGDPSLGRLMSVALPALALSLLYIAMVGFDSLFTSRDALGAAVNRRWPDPTTAAVIQSVTRMPLLVSCVALMSHVRRARGVPGLGVRLFLVVCVTMLLIIVNPVSSARYVFGTVAVSLLAAAGGYSTRRRYRIVTTAFLTSFVLVFPFADAFRHSGVATYKAGGVLQALTTGDFDSYQQIQNALLYVDERGVTYGRQALGVVLFWVPRSVWSSKPLDTGILLGEFRGYDFTNLSAPLWAEFLVNGSWIVLAGGMYAFGRLSRRWDQRIVRLFSARMDLGPLGSILPIYLIIILRGSLLQATANVTVIVAAAALVRRRASSSEEQGPNSEDQSAEHLISFVVRKS